jgi:hypothetical protein
LIVRLRVIGLLLALGVSMHVCAGDVPVDVQMRFFPTIWRMDRSLAPETPVTVAIAYQARNRESSYAYAEAEKALTAKSIRVLPVALDGDAGVNALRDVRAEVLYVTRMRGIDIRAIAAITREKHIRTMSATVDYIALGLSVAIGSRNDRPLIIINLEAARAEGASYQAQLLQLAEIIR